MSDSDTECIVCKSSIKKGAKKCVHCNSRQDGLRFLDVGNTSLSLLIAALSLLALAATVLVNVANFFTDKTTANVAVNIDYIDPKRLSLFIGNDGPGLAIVSPYVHCEIWMGGAAKALGRMTGQPPVQADLEKREIFVYVAKSTKSFVIQPGSHFIWELAGERWNRLDYRTLHSPKTDEKSVCNISFKHQSGRSDAVAEEFDDTFLFTVAEAKRRAFIGPQP
jgi:hypothetical protein